MKSRSSIKGRQPLVQGLVALVALAIVVGWTGVTNTSRAYAATTVFDDEFNSTSLDTTAWVAMNRPGDQSNAEQQCYKPGNASVDGANLVILTKVDSSCTNYSYTSAMVQWKTFNFLYGYVEVKAKLAGGTGPWPAIWMLGLNCQQSNVTDPNICPWPQPGSDEIDIAEILGSNHNNVNQSIFSSNGNEACIPANTSDVSQNWHTYGLTWSAGKVVWSIDGTDTCTKTGASVPSNPMFLLINTALGGFGGGTINPATLPQSSFIDYVRVTQGTPPPAPTVSAVAPTSGPATGWTSVVITGTNFSGASAVKFGPTAATTFTVNGATQITATSPAGSGTVDVTVTTSGGTSAINSVDKFTYTATPAPTVTMLAPTTGPAAGGTSVVITGTNFTGASGVKFGTTAATTFTVNNATQITATSPPGLATVDVTVTTASGTSGINAVDKFTYTGPPPPTVASVAPNNGPSTGGTSVVITGANFIGATAVKFGATAATAFTVNSATQVTATSPAGTGTGTVDVTVTTPNGTSATSSADLFTYLLACTAASTPAAFKASSTSQYSLANSNGGSWQEIDAAKLRLACAPSAGQSLLLTANADLFTGNAGFNQDFGIFVSDNGGADQLLAWKESGGFAGTFSPNAAYVQKLFAMTSGHTYVFKLKWKANKNASGATIFAGAGSGPYSPTSLVAEAFPTAEAPNFAFSTSQYTLANSNGSTWQSIDAVNLSTTLSPVANSTAVLGGNADLWTANAGYNQDLGIFVSDNGGPDTLVAWKESGGFAGTFSPNAAFVKATYAMSAGHTYVFKLKWKTNGNAPGTTIFAASGTGPVFSPTSLLAETLAAGANPYTAVSTNQYSLSNSNGTTWQTVDSALNVTVAPGASTNSILGANADLWTANAGYNQDFGIFVSDNGGADTLVAWKESGGFAGTFSPNAAFVQATYQMTSGHTYVFKLKWKANKNAAGAAIFAAAGGPAPFSSTRLTVELTS